MLTRNELYILRALHAVKTALDAINIDSVAPSYRGVYAEAVTVLSHQIGNLGYDNQPNAEELEKKRSEGG